LVKSIHRKYLNWDVEKNRRQFGENKPLKLSTEWNDFVE